MGKHRKKPGKYYKRHPDIPNPEMEARIAAAKRDRNQDSLETFVKAAGFSGAMPMTAGEECLFREHCAYLLSCDECNATRYSIHEDEKCVCGWKMDAVTWYGSQ